MKYYKVLDTEQEREFDEIVELASQICQTPISLISLIDSERQWFKAEKGLGLRETSRDVSFCAHALKQKDLMIIPDAHQDNRFFDNPLVTASPNISFYAGMPLITPNGYVLGTLCVIDNHARQLNDTQQFALRLLARQVVRQLELRVKIDELKTLNHTHHRLLSIITHDLRSPMHHLSSLVQLLDQEYLQPADFMRLLADVRLSLSASEEMLNNLMQWALAQFEGKTLQIQSLNLYNLVMLEMEQHRGILQKKNNVVQIIIPPNLQVLADTNMLRCVLRNLVLNANKFTEGGNISISARQIKQEVEIQVQDTGSGMDADKVKNLFIWEKRSGNRGTQGEPGSGLGLQVCADLLIKMDGSIRAESIPGAGTSIFFRLPVA